MNKVVKAASGITAAGGLGGAAYGTYDYKTATFEYLIGFDPSIIFVEEGDNKDAQLSALIDSYKVSAAAIGKEISGFKLQNDDEKDKKALFDKCKELRRTSIRLKSDENLNKIWTRVMHWCVVIVNVEDALRREGKKVIKEYNLQNRDSEWKELITSTPDADKEGLKSFLNITDKLSDQHSSVLKEKCNAAFIEAPGDEYKTNLENARKYCIKRSDN